MSDQLPLNRQLLAQFLPNPQLIRAFENLFSAVYVEGASNLQDLQVDSQSAQLKAGEALEKLADVANLLASVLLHPLKEQTQTEQTFYPIKELSQTEQQFFPATFEWQQQQNLDVARQQVQQDVYTPPNALNSCAEQVYSSGSWNPTVSSTSGSITSYSVAYAKWIRIGDLLFVNFNLTITNNGTGGGAILLSLPFASKNAEIGKFREGAATGKMGAIVTSAGSNSAAMVFYDNGYPGGASYSLTGNLTYRI